MSHQFNSYSSGMTHFISKTTHPFWKYIFYIQCKFWKQNISILSFDNSQKVHLNIFCHIFHIRCIRNRKIFTGNNKGRRNKEEKSVDYASLYNTRERKMWNEMRNKLSREYEWKLFIRETIDNKVYNQ